MRGAFALVLAAACSPIALALASCNFVVGEYKVTNPEAGDEVSEGSTPDGYHDVSDSSFWSTFDVATAGAQDNGTTVQNGTGNVVWTTYAGNDGGDPTGRNPSRMKVRRKFLKIEKQNRVV